jgi:hypothetical protein
LLSRGKDMDARDTPRMTDSAIAAIIPPQVWTDG